MGKLLTEADAVPSRIEVAVLRLVGADSKKADIEELKHFDRT